MNRAAHRDGVLNVEPNIAAGDEFYEALIDMHRDLSEAESALVNARLILLLANHIGDPRVLRAAMQVARGDAGTRVHATDEVAKP